MERPSAYHQPGGLAASGATPADGGAQAGTRPLRGDGSPQLSIVVPAYNEQEVLGAFHERLTAVTRILDASCEIVYVNDGSTDDTLRIMRDLRDRDSSTAVIDLSRNFGKEIALTAGLDHARGEAVIVIDADLQDPPEVIPELVARWRAGYDVVYTRRTARDGETVLKRVTAGLFYRLIRRVSRVQIPQDTGDFRLLSRRAVDALGSLREQHRFMKGLFAWIGFPQTAVLYRRDPRHAGETKWNYWRLWNLAIEGITSFTIAPLKISAYLGIVVAVLAFAFGAFIMYRTLMYGDPVRGYPSLMVVVLFLGGVQLITLGVIGEYLGRVFNETKRRPLYLLNAYHPSLPVVARSARRALGAAALHPDEDHPNSVDQRDGHHGKVIR